MHAIILAAGMGKRLRPLTENIPKAMIELRNGARIIDVICCNLLSVGVDGITIVVGHASSALRKYVESKDLYKEFQAVSFVENKDYKSTNTGFSLLLALEGMNQLRRDILIVNGDIIFDQRILKKLTMTPGTAIVIDNVKKLTEESFKVLIKDGRIVEMGKQVDVNIASGEYIGLSKIAENDIDVAVGILRSIVSKDRNAYYDLLFQELSKFLQVRFVYTDGLLWTEVDFPDDLEYAKKIINLIHLGSRCVF